MERILTNSITAFRFLPDSFVVAFVVFPSSVPSFSTRTAQPPRSERRTTLAMRRVGMAWKAEEVARRESRQTPTRLNRIQIIETKSGRSELGRSGDALLVLLGTGCMQKKPENRVRKRMSSGGTSELRLPFPNHDQLITTAIPSTQLLSIKRKPTMGKYVLPAPPPHL